MQNLLRKHIEYNSAPQVLNNRIDNPAFHNFPKILIIYNHMEKKVVDLEHQFIMAEKVLFQK